MQEQYEKLNSIKAQILNELQQNQNKIQQLEEQKGELEQQLENSLKKIEEYQSKSDNSFMLVQLKQQYQKSLNSKQAEIEELRQVIETEKRDKLRQSQKIETLLLQKGQYSNEIKTLNQKIINMQAKIDAGKDKVKQEKELREKEKQNMENNINKLLEATQKERVSKHLGKLDETKYLQQIEKLKMNELKMKNNLQSINRDLAKSQLKLTESTTQCNDLLQEVRTLKDSNIELANSLAQSSISIKMTKDQLNKQSFNENYLLDTIQTLKRQNKQKQQKISQIDGLFKSQREMTDQLRVMLRKSQTNMASRANIQDSLNRKYDELNVKSQQMGNQLFEKERQNRKYRLKIEELELNYQKVKERLIRQQQSKYQAQKLRSNAQQKLLATEKKFAQIYNLNEKNYKLREEKSMLMEQLENQNHKCVSLRQFHVSLSFQLQEYFDLWANGEIDLHKDDEEDYIHSPPTKDKSMIDDGGYDGDDDDLNLRNNTSMGVNVGEDV